MRMGLSRKCIVGHRYKYVLYKLYFYIIFVITLFSFSLVIYRMESAFINAFTPFAINLGSDSINYTVADYFKVNEYSYSDFVTLTYDEKNMVTSLQSNSSLMNLVKSELSILLQNELSARKENEIKFPLGNISDNIIFHGLGPVIAVNVSSAEVTDLVFNDEFVAVGINQVKHKIFIEAYVTVSLSCASLTLSEVIHDTIPVAETVIVGDVPNYYGDNVKMPVLTNNMED